MCIHTSACSYSMDDWWKRVFFTRRFWSALCIFVAGVLLIVSISTPWYSVHIHIPKSATPIFEQIDSIHAVWWWQGLYIIADREGDLAPETRWIQWDKINADQAEATYFAAMANVIGALGGSILVLFMIVFCLLFPPTRELSERCFCSYAKVFVCLVTVVAVVCPTIVGWGVFISWPTALSNAQDKELCPSNMAFFQAQLPSNVDLWCGSFIGREKLTDFNDVVVAWAPESGWYFALMATLPSLIASILLALVTRLPPSSASDAIFTRSPLLHPL
eukprot:TRINITY_DN10666_c0_g1_i1.p1 TRINITY_DN10666_c0_g1~~TRINITY_DN10666_c0_g1_i1.p1  ORF type:complete len:275 (+),score=17.30 TRINITY_DN10666_c0_g1_i1:88-912(+)